MTTVRGHACAEAPGEVDLNDPFAQIRSDRGKQLMPTIMIIMIIVWYGSYLHSKVLI